MRVALISLFVLGACSAPRPAPESPDAAVEPCFTLDRNDFDFDQVSGPVTGHFVLTNPSGRLLRVEASPPSSPFRFEIPSDPLAGANGIFVAPGARVSMVIGFETTDSLVHLGRLVLREQGREACTQTVTLRAIGPGQVTGPLQLDFGNVDLGGEKTVALELLNSTREAVTVQSLELSETTPGTFSSPALTAPLVIAPLSLAKLPVRGQALQPVLVTGSIVVRVVGHPVLVVPLRLVVGTPLVRLEGAPVVIPELGLRPNATPQSFARRTLRLHNMGTDGAPEAQLQLVSPFLEFTDGAVEDLPDGGAPELELELGPFTSARAGKSFDFGIKVMPRQFGPHTWHVRLFTTGPSSPVEFDVTTNVVALPDCTLDMPHDARLGVPATGTATFTLRNVGTTRCVLDHLVFEAPRQPAVHHRRRGLRAARAPTRRSARRAVRLAQPGPRHEQGDVPRLRSTAGRVDPRARQAVTSSPSRDPRPGATPRAWPKISSSRCRISARSRAAKRSSRASGSASSPARKSA